MFSLFWSLSRIKDGSNQAIGVGVGLFIENKVWGAFRGIQGGYATRHARLGGVSTTFPGPNRLRFVSA